MAFRFGGNFARFIAVVVLVCCSFTYVTAQIYGTGLIASRFLGMQFEIAVFAGLVGILLCAMLGGMRAVTWTQIAQYIVLIVAYLTPIVILSTKRYGIPIPELTYGAAIAEITAREQQMLATGLATAATLKPHIQPFINYSPLNFFAIIFCMMVGTASLPHILMRYFTTPSVREARQSVGWSLFFIFLLYFSAPAYAAFSKLEVYTNIIGRDLTQVRPWMFTWGELGLIQICGKNAASIDAIVAACKAIAGHPGVVRLQDFVINTDVIVLSTPEVAGLPYVISGLVAAGGLRRRFPPLMVCCSPSPMRCHTTSTTRCSTRMRRLFVGSPWRECSCSSWRWQRLRPPRPNRQISWPWSAGRSRSPWPATSRRSSWASGGNELRRRALSAA